MLYQKLQINNKNEFWKTVRLTSVEKKKQNKRQLQSFQYPLSLSIGALTGPYSVIYNLFFNALISPLCFYVSLNLVSILSLTVWILIGDDSYENVHVILLKQIVLKMCIERVSLNHCTWGKTSETTAVSSSTNSTNYD